MNIFLPNLVQHKTSANWLAEEYAKLIPEFNMKLSDLPNPELNTEVIYKLKNFNEFIFRMMVLVEILILCFVVLI